MQRIKGLPTLEGDRAEPKRKMNASLSVKLLQNLFLLLFSNLTRVFAVVRTKMDYDSICWMRMSLYRMVAVSHQILQEKVVNEARENWLWFCYITCGCRRRRKEKIMEFWFSWRRKRKSDFGKKKLEEEAISSLRLAFIDFQDWIWVSLFCFFHSSLPFTSFWTWHSPCRFALMRLAFCVVVSLAFDAAFHVTIYAVVMVLRLDCNCFSLQCTCIHFLFHHGNG